MSTITKILIAEHDVHDLELLHHELKKSGIHYVSETVINEKGFRSAIKKFLPDLILSDYTFPSFNGPAAFKIKEEIAADIPFIFVSGAIGEEKAVELIRNGATDYILKDKLFTLSVKIKRALKESGKKREKDNANRAFQKALSEYQKIMNSSLDVICTIDEEGKFVNVSSASERIFGFKPEELKGSKYIDLVYHEDIENTNNAAAGVMNGISVTFFENRYTRKDGSLVPIIWSATWDDEDKLMYCIAKDATEKKQLEKAFEIERQRFYDLFLQAPSCMGILKGPGHIFEMANPLYLKLINKENILGKTVKQVLPEVVEQGFIKILDSVYHTGKTFSANEMLIKLDKKGDGEFVDIYLNFIYQPHKNVDGNVEGIFFFAVEVTEQVILRKKIEERENRFRAMIENSNDMITLVNREGILTYCSPSITKILGYTLKELLHKPDSEFIHPDDIAAFKKQINEIAQTPGKSFSNEQRVLGKNGEWMWNEGTVTNLLDEKGVHAIVSNFRDISERKIAEQQRQFDSNNLDALINSTNDLMWSVDRDFKLITSNQPFHNIIKSVSGRELAKGDSVFSAVLSQEQLNRFQIIYSRVFAGEVFTELEYIDSPVESWSEISYQPIRNGADVVGAACHSRDVTVIKKAERTVILSEKRFRALVENGNDGVIILSATGKFNYVSPSIERILGYTEEEAMNLDMFSLFHPDQLAGTAKVWQQVMESPGIPVPGHPIQMLHKNGTWRWLEATITNMLHDPSINGIVDNYRDVTERIKAEQQREFDQNNLNALINSTKDLMWSVDRNFKLITSNQPFDDVIMITSGQVVKKGEIILNENFLTEQTIRFKKAYERAFAGESFTETVYSDIPSETWSEISYSPMHHDKKIVGVACHSRDITQLKINERTISDERILLRTLIDNLPSSVYTKDIYSKKTLSNRKDYEFIGVSSEEEVLGKDDSWFFSEETSKNTRIEEQQIFYTGEPIINKEEHQKKKDGTTAWFLKSKIPLRNQHNEIIGLVGISYDITERKKIESALVESEKEIRDLAESMPQIVWVTNAEGGNTYFNQKWVDYTGLTLEESYGDGWLIPFNEDDKPLAWKAWNNAVTNLAEYTVECRLRKYDGSYHWWLIRGIPKINELGKILKWYGTCTNIEKIKQTEQHLQKSEAFNRGVLNSLSSHIAVIDATGNIIAVNEAWKRFGIENGATSLQRTAIGSNYYEVCKKSGKEGIETALEVLQGMKDVMNEKINFFNTEYPCHSLNEQRWFSVRAMKFESDEPMIVVAHQNISARKLAEEKLLKSESGLKEAQAIAKIGNWEIDLETNIHTWSDEYCNILRIIKEEAHPSLEYYLSFVHPEDIDHVKKIIQENQNTSSPIPYEFRFIRKDGVIRYGYAQSRFEFDKNNKPIRLFGVIQDITERKLIEFRLEHQNKELIKTNFELDRFVYSVSHELRAPLTSVLGLLSFIEEESKESDTLGYAEMIKTNIYRLDGFIRNILSYSRNNRVELQVEKIPLQKTVGEIVDSLRNMKHAKGIDFEVNLHEHQPFYSDVQTFCIIMENLISNAIKFQNVEISGRYIKIKGSADKHNLKLTIEDNGIGISPEYHDKIFNMFFRLSGKTGGSGLGLYIVKEMIEKMQGTIHVNSQEGAGTVFTIKLKNQTPISNPIQTSIKYKSNIN